MKTTVADICVAMNNIAPVRFAEEWDNPGLLIGDTHKSVKKIMLALDLMPEVAQQAVEAKVDMIITHHPVYFKLPKTLAITDIKMYFIYELIKHNIAAYAAHTNLDAAQGGVNDVLAKKLGLLNVKTLEEPGKEQGIPRIGEVKEPMTLEEFALKVKKALHCDGVAYTEGGKKVQKVVVVGGGGISYLNMALEAGADTMVTADMKYHPAQDALNLGMNVIDAGHQTTEAPVLDFLEASLTKWATESKRKLEIIRADEEQIIHHV
jgi:dinuclear metal center YbgI/SA1388 family protein